MIERAKFVHERWTRGALAVIAGLIAAPELVAGAVVTVPGDYATIQEAVDAVQSDTDPGEVIVESDGSFDEAVLIEQSVTVRAGAGFSPAIEPIGSMSGPLRVVSDGRTDTNVEIEGLTLRFADGNSVVFLRNRFDEALLSVEMEEVTIEGQNVDEGIIAFADGGVVLLAMGLSSIEIVGDDAGSPVCVRLLAAGFSAGAILVDNTFRFARAGGLRLQGGFDGGSAVTLAFSNVFESFESNGVAGRNGVLIRGLNNPMGDFSTADARLLNNLFVGTDIAIEARAVRQHEIEVTANNNTIVGAFSRGIALRASEQSTLTARLANNVVAGTGTTTSGPPQGTVGGIGIDASVVGPDAVIDLVNGHNLLFDNLGGDYGGIAMPGPGDVFADPLFVAPAQENYRLGAGSPAIDAGDNDPPGGTGGRDLDNEVRVVDGDGDGTPTVDIGAYERVPALVEVPTLSTAALLGFAVLLAAAAAWRLRRRPA